MRRLNSWMAWSFLALGPLGCGLQAPATTTQTAAPVAAGGLAVIDLDAVAKAVGRADDMNQMLKIQEGALNQSLNKIGASFQEQIDKKKAEVGAEPTPEQTKEVAKLQIEAQSRLTNTKRQAQSRLSQYQQQLVAQFRDEVRPIAQQVAQQKGLSVVIPRNEGLLLSVDPGADITAEVTKAFLAKMATQPKAAMPKASAEAPAKAPAQTAEKPAPQATETK